MCSVRQRSARRRRGVHGISIIETMMAAGLVALGVLMLGSGSIALSRGGKIADSVGVATALAQQQLERLRSMPLGAPQLLPGNYADAANPLQADGTGGGRFTRTWTVSGDDVPTFGLRTVTVTVRWTDWLAHQTQLAAFVRCSKVPC